MKTIFDSIKKKKKVNVNLTLDEDVEIALQKYKSDNDITSLSPMVNAMLKDWLNSQNDPETKEEESQHE